MNEKIISFLLLVSISLSIFFQTEFLKYSSINFFLNFEVIFIKDAVKNTSNFSSCDISVAIAAFVESLNNASDIK